MKRKIVYLVNPVSGTSRKQSVMDMITGKTEDQGFPFEIVSTNPENDYDFLRLKIQQEGITDIVICGGDGSVSGAAGALLDLPVRFGIIPLGSGNGLALAAMIPYNPAKALDIIFHCYSALIDGFYINNKFSCMLAGIGFDAQVAQDFAESKTRGLQTYIRVSAINYLKASSHNFIIRSGETIIETRAFFISIANSNQFGNNFTIAPRASLNDGLLDIVIVKQMNKLILPFSILNQVTGINTLKKVNELPDSANILYFQSGKLTISNPDLAPLHIDGDPCATSHEISVEILPNAFRLIQPQPLVS